MNLIEIEQQRLERRERLRNQVRLDVRTALDKFLPGEDVILFGSIISPYHFHDRSDVDIALYHAPVGRSIYGLVAQLDEYLGRAVDLVVLDETRLKEKILTTGEVWTRSV